MTLAVRITLNPSDNTPKIKSREEMAGRPFCVRRMRLRDAYQDRSDYPPSVTSHYTSLFRR